VLQSTESEVLRPRLAFFRVKTMSLVLVATISDQQAPAL